MTDLKIGRDTGQSGGTAETADLTTQFLRKDGVYAVPSVVSAVQVLNAGTDTAPSAPVLTAVAGTNGGGGVQLTDLTRDYMVYLEVGTAGTAWIVSAGPTSAASAVTIHASGVATAGQVLSFRLPAGWYFLWSATTATLAQSVAVGC
jgi:hypothetical protein